MMWLPRTSSLTQPTQPTNSGIGTLILGADPRIVEVKDQRMGEHMVVSLRERLGWFAAQPEWEGLRFTINKAALTRGDIRRHRLPPNPTKMTDTRAARHIARHGDV